MWDITLSVETLPCNFSFTSWNISVWTTAAAEQRRTPAAISPLMEKRKNLRTALSAGEALDSLSKACSLQEVTWTQTESVPAASLAVSSRMGQRGLSLDALLQISCCVWQWSGRGCVGSSDHMLHKNCKSPNPQHGIMQRLCQITAVMLTQ